MQFTPRDVVQGARDRAPRPREVTLTPDQIAREFNDILLDLVQEYLWHDPERLAERVTISNADVSGGDTVDVTKSTTIEWLEIHGIDWRANAGDDYADEVVIVTQEARTRATHEFDYLGNPIGYFSDRDREIVKLANWNGVHDLQIHGTLAPAEISPGDWLVLFDYPAPLYRVLQLRFVINLSGHLGLDEARLQLAMQELDIAVDRLQKDAEGHISGDLRVEDVPHGSFYR